MSNDHIDRIVEESRKWQVYDCCAEWCAKRGLRGRVGDLLPNLLDSSVLDLINNDPEKFEERVRQFAYALAMEAHNAND